MNGDDSGEGLTQQAVLDKLTNPTGLFDDFHGDIANDFVTQGTT